MKGHYGSRVARDEKIAAEVEIYRQEHYPDLSLWRMPEGDAKPVVAYPLSVYRPSDAFVQRMEALRKPPVCRGKR